MKVYALEMCFGPFGASKSKLIIRISGFRGKFTTARGVNIGSFSENSSLKMTNFLLTSLLGNVIVMSCQAYLARKGGVNTMNKEEILAKAQEENKGMDPADREAQKLGGLIAYIVIVWLIITVDTVNGLVLHYVNRGADFALFSMSFTMFLVKYIKLRKTHELIVAIIFGLLAIAMLVVWILQLLKVL